MKSSLRPVEVKPRLSSLRRRRSSGAVVLLSAPLLLGSLIDIDEGRATLFGVRGVPCLVQQVIGDACPGCGLTRSLSLSTQGKWNAALKVHPGGAALAVLCLSGLLVHGHMLLSGRRTRGHRALLRWGYRAFIIALLSVWLLRIW